MLEHPPFVERYGGGLDVVPGSHKGTDPTAHGGSAASSTGCGAGVGGKVCSSSSAHVTTTGAISDRAGYQYLEGHEYPPKVTNPASERNLMLA